ncbi:Helix-turn-helix [Roseovarius nanhaiticus]|uniref:Helix-turn-helix n=1 Tax=Roseovarius nanhaiticus TaxID=573024 RepID=A0A1N7FL33_9RHOB|nr:helix-turn-helix transcriptional regulator [Roseovarius nanhaiticus]SEK52000.1 Helix-turn-helix [Roseovarius nanhaiticus]SIS00984.1 Helix-turn-helix [Roseovarius nanhaiticus]
MSSQVAYVGQRMREVREELGHSQAKLAAMLELSDRAYKNYELGKREAPLSVIAEFSSKFNVDLRWLVFGSDRQSFDTALVELACETSAITFSMAISESKAILTDKKYDKFYRYVLDQCMIKGTSPEHEAKAVFDLMRGDDE